MQYISIFATIRGLRSVVWKVKVSNRRLGLNTRIDKARICLCIFNVGYLDYIRMVTIRWSITMSLDTRQYALEHIRPQ